MLLPSCGSMLLSMLGGFLLLSSITHVNAEPQVFSMETKHMSCNVLQKRDASAVSVTNFFNVFYYVNATVGTPGQNISFVLDTVSSDVWMSGPELSGNSLLSAFAVEGSYEVDYATSVQDAGSVKGKFFNDTISLDNYKLENFTMVVISDAPSLMQSILGLVFGQDGNMTVLDAMVAAGLIKSRTYSLWLSGHKSQTGQIIFGGYDTGKYDGEITTLNSQSDSAFVVALTSLSISPYEPNTRKARRQSGDDAAESFGLDGPLTSIIDSSATLTMLPGGLVARLAKYVGATQAGENLGYVLPCQTNMNAELVFQLGGEGGLEIYVDMTELLIPILDDNFVPKTYPGQRITMCGLGVWPVDDNTPVILGQTFLRSAYVFFDIDLKQVGFAQAKWDVEDSDIQEVANGGSVKSASSVAGASITQSTSAVKGAPGAGFGNVTLNVEQPASPVTSLEGGVKTTLSGDRPCDGDKASATESSTSHSSSAAAALVVVEQWNLHIVLLALCDSIMLVAATFL